MKTKLYAMDRTCNNVTIIISYYYDFSIQGNFIIMNCFEMKK